MQTGTQIGEVAPRWPSYDRFKNRWKMQFGGICNLMGWLAGDDDPDCILPIVLLLKVHWLEITGAYMKRCAEPIHAD
jgi:hypothetical protein